MVLKRLRQDGVVDSGPDLEELEEIVGRAVERAVERLRREEDYMQVAQRVLRVYKFFENEAGDKHVAVELTRIVFSRGCSDEQ